MDPSPRRPTSPRGGGSPRGSPRGAGGLKVGMKVSARYRGKARYYPGRIGRANEDGTFNIDYDDGENESYVKAEFIKPLDGFVVSSPRSPRRGSLEEGMKIEARYRGK